MMKTLLGILITCACAAALGAEEIASTASALSSTQSAVVAGKRDPRWAVPIEKPGLPNLHKVTDDLYRGAQPTEEGFRELKKMGIKTFVNLRAFHSDKDEIKGLDFAYENIDIKTWHAEDEDIVRFLKIVTDKTKAPVFVHCLHGADRTGMMIAVYRIAIQGWSKEDAIKEMTEGGYGWHPIWRNLLGHIRELDVDALKRASGISPANQIATKDTKAPK